ncbi:alpha/beta fold hydrolase [Candidatus Marithioploca araucensis]|jgi:lysophospholipase|uniref:Alpha/beta fold hydrolase n=1 Tax=Candidatus Marithioploca araucensis TaxID=70273 RepID=A0ABT7VUS0_9GAMM|nr:alpha/beta fold hydrolase [Candidatus Marithioploca araucensis]
MYKYCLAILKAWLYVLIINVANITIAYSDNSNVYEFLTELELKSTQTEINKNWERRIEGEFLGVDDIKIKYVSILNEDEKGAVVISSGRIESYIKYEEIISDLGKQGYSVYIHDHRGQGFSGRMTKNPEMGHVWDFDDYIEDLKTFYTRVVTQKEHQKTFLLAHSMGGGIAALYIERYPNDFDAAVLSSPMLEPSTKMFYSDKIACDLVGITSRIRNFFIWAFGWEPRYVVGIEEAGYRNIPFQNEEGEKEHELTHSQIRYKIFRDLYEANPTVKLGKPTIHWVAYACNAAKEARNNADKIVIPVLVLQAAQDTSVTAKGQNEFCKNLKAGGKNECDGGRPYVIEGAFHELFIETDKYRKPALTRIFDFFNRQYNN